MKAHLDDRLYAALMGEMTPKFLATKDESGIPNVVPVISIRPYDHKTLIFGNFFMDKTEKNLTMNDQVTAAVFTEDLFGTTIRGVFKGFQKAGEYVDLINSSNLMRYNAYMGIRNAGSIEIEDISHPFQLTKMDMLSWNLCSRLHNAWGKRYTQGKPILHPVVAQKYGRIAAVKVISFVDEKGYPYAVPVVALQPVAPDVLIFSKRPMTQYLSALKENADVAATVITTEPVAFQVKGTYKGIDGKWGAIVLNKTYHASPPFVGKQIA
jgi:hypothetical protein